MKQTPIAARLRPQSKQRPSESIPDEATTTIAASVPRSVVAAVKAHSGRRGFSRFVTAALERELRHIARRQIVEDVVEGTGPLDPANVEAARRLIRS